MKLSDDNLPIAEYNDLFDYDRFPLKNEGGKSYRYAYGNRFWGNPTDLEIEMFCARNRMTVEQGGLGEQAHYKEIFCLLFPYMRQEWHYWMDMFLECMCGYNVTNTILGGGGLGKALNNNSRIKIPGGWTTHGEIKVGDVVCTPEGGEANVTHVWPQGEIDLYKVTFSDGTSVECCGDHLWLTTTTEDRKKRNKHKLRSEGSVKTTLDIMDTLSSRKERFEANHHIPLTEPVPGYSGELPIAPYTLGALLGDGCLRNQVCLIVGDQDADIIDYVVADGYPVKVTHYSEKNSSSVYLSALKPTLEKMGLYDTTSSTKFIPEQYLHARLSERWDLFRGLVDTDGSASLEGGVEYTTSSEQLATDIRELGNSLGLISSITSRIPKYTHKGEKKEGKRSWRLRFKIPSSYGNPFYCKRKRDMFIPRSGRIEPSRAIVSIEPIGKGEATCITIDSEDQLYLTEDYIVTHNSWLLGTFAGIWHATDPKRREVLIINTTQKSQTKRTFKYVSDLYRYFPFLMPGVLGGDKNNPALHMYETVYDKKTDKDKFVLIPGAGIHTNTLKKGSSAVATADLKGDHPPEYMIIGEETNHMKRTHLERVRANAITNRMYILAFVGNPAIEDIADTTLGREDALYHFSTPMHGWNSHEWGERFVWETKFGGRAYHFDSEASPRITSPKKFQVSLWLPDKEYIERKRMELGGAGSLLYKQQIRGIYDHSALPQNPISPELIKHSKAKTKALFTGQGRQRWAALDPSFGGNDEAFLKIAESGLCSDNNYRLDYLGETTNFVFQKDPDNAENFSFQMLEWVREKLGVWGVPYGNFTMDANLIGTSLGHIFSKFLSKSVLNARISGRPSAVHIGAKKAQDICANIKTEHMMGLQYMLLEDSIRGLDESCLDQLYDWPLDPSSGQDDKTKILGKTKFKKLFGYSPDRAECILWIADMARRRGMDSMEVEASLGVSTGVERGIVGNPFIQYQGGGNPFVNENGYGGMYNNQSSENWLMKPKRKEDNTRDKQAKQLVDAYRAYDSAKRGRG